jgi:uncharacterized DUF497 family protein
MPAKYISPGLDKNLKKCVLLTSYTKKLYTKIMEGCKIVWDQDKAAENLKKHRVSFDTAALVFLDPSRIERRDDSENNTSREDRWQTLGVVGKVFFVVYTERVNGNPYNHRPCRK